MKLDYTNETVFSFDGPNLCLLGNEADFLQLAKSIVDLTGKNGVSIDLLDMDFIESAGEQIKVIFSSKKGSKNFGVWDNDETLLFELDYHLWDRLFKYFILMSWKKTTYYLNANESYLSDLELSQDCNFICSSEF
jgi:hypothetical protein